MASQLHGVEIWDFRIGADRSYRLHAIVKAIVLETEHRKIYRENALYNVVSRTFVTMSHLTQLHGVDTTYLHLSWSLKFLVLYAMFCRSLFVLLYFFFWPLWPSIYGFWLHLWYFQRVSTSIKQIVSRCINWRYHAENTGTLGWTWTTKVYC
jgi:hypothetical protein